MVFFSFRFQKANCVISRRLGGNMISCVTEILSQHLLQDSRKQKPVSMLPHFFTFKTQQPSFTTHKWAAWGQSASTESLHNNLMWTRKADEKGRNEQKTMRTRDAGSDSALVNSINSVQIVTFLLCDRDLLTHFWHVLQVYKRNKIMHQAHKIRILFLFCYTNFKTHQYRRTLCSRPIVLSWSLHPCKSKEQSVSIARSPTSWLEWESTYQPSASL